MPTALPDDMPLALAPEPTAEPALATPVPAGVPLEPTSPEPPEPVETLPPEPAVAGALPDVTELPVVVVAEFPEPPLGVPEPMGTVFAS
jgi:hypothetical protein